ncbi:MAG: carboxypeptidase regulatory-like domain-containing protein [Caldilineaceae bacterium]
MLAKKLRINLLCVVLLLAILATTPLSVLPARAQSPQPPLAQAQIQITGLEVQPSPASQVVPKNTGTIVSPLLVRPDHTNGELPTLPADALFLAELRGPALSTPLPLSARPNEPFVIPPLPLAGLYSLENIRLVSGGQTLLQGNPDAVRIEVIDKVLQTQVTSRPLTADEIQAAGIVIDQTSFHVVNFTVAFGLQNQQVKIDFPVIMPSKPQTNLTVGTPIVPVPQLSPTLPPDNLLPGLRLAFSTPNVSVSGFSLNVDDAEKALPGLVDPLPGVVIIPGNIAYLNQFFSVILKVSNVAPGYSNLEVRDLKGEIVLPNSADEPLRMARVADASGAPQVQPKIKPVTQAGPDGKLGTADDITTLSPQQNADAEFLVEGRSEGVYTVNIKITGTLYGLPGGPVGVHGQAVGVVEVRNPTFSLTLNHPATISAGEEYDFLVTVTNISDTPANFASLSLLPSSISGAELLSDQVVQFATIAGGDSATAKFRLKALKTGNVVATSLAAAGTPGKFELRTAVGELGIPMSPNSLVLPPTTDHLPDALRQAGLELLNQAYAVASAPTTPKGLLPMSKDIVVQHASDLAAAGQRIQMTEPLLSVSRDLALDFIGNNYTRINERFGADGSPLSAAKQLLAQQDYAGFDALLRQSHRGANFIQAVANIWASAVLTDGVLGFQANFAQAAVARPAHISAIVGSGKGPASVVLNLTDPANLHLGVLSPGAAPVQEVPYGAFATLLDAAPKASQLAMIAVPQAGTHTVEVIGTDSGSFDLGLVVPEGVQLRHLTFVNVPIQVGGRAHVVFTVGGTNNYVLALDQNGDGVADQQINPTVNELVVDNGPQPISAVQIFSNERHGIAQYGQLMGLLFNQEVSAASAQSGLKPEQITHYQVEANQVQGVALQPGGRVVLMALRDGIGPFIQRHITVTGLTNRLGHAMQPAPVTLPIHTTVTADGGTVSGTVRQADGAPVPFAQIGLVQIELDLNDDPYPVTVSVKNADSAGHYAFDYVRADKTIFQYIDPQSGASGVTNTEIRYNGQHLDLDLILLGTGTLAGHVLAADGHTPLAGAVIRVINPLKAQDQYGATSDANGAYIIGKIPVGNLSIEAAHVPSQSKALFAATIPNAGATVLQDLILQPVTQTNSIGALTGQVFRTDGVTPVSGIPVYTNHGGVATTDAAGVYRIDGLPTGPIVIRAIDQTLLQQATVATTVVSDQTVTANLLLVGGIGAIKGVVLEADGTPAPGLKVYGGPSIVQTDATGAFTMTNVPVGIVQLTVVDEVHQRQATANATLTHDGETVNVQVILPAAGVLAGRVFNMVNGVKTPVPGLKIFALGPRSDKQFTGTDGSYRFENMPLGDYTISAFNPDFSDGNIARGKLVFKDETLQLDVTFKGKGSVTGIVYDDDGVTPVGARVGLTELRVKLGQLIPAENPTCMGSIDLGGAMIQLPQCETVGVDYEVVRRNRRINSDGSTGKFQFNDVFVGDFTVEAASAFSPDAVAVSGKVPAPGASVPVTLSLQSTGAISGTVFQPDGLTPVGAGVIVQFDSGTISNVRVQTDAQGHFSFPLVSPGGFMLTAQNAISGTVGQTSGSVQVGQTAVMPIRLLRLGSVKVLVNGANGPVVGANVTLEHGGFPATKRTGVTQADGTLTFAGGDSISEGPFSVTAVQSGVRGFTSSAIPALPASGQVAVVVTLSNAAGTVQGQFLRSDNVTPIPNAQVALETSNGTAYATTDANGGYVFDGVLTGSFTLSGFDPVTGRRGKISGQLTTNGQVITLNIQPVPQGTVTGTVRRSTDNAPVVGAEVILTISGPLGGQVRASSGANGAFSLPGVSAGSFNLSASDPTGHFFGAANGTLTTEGQTVVADVTIQVPVTGRVEGHITKAAPGGLPTPANAAQVTYNSTSPGVSGFGTTTTDNNGFYFFDNVPKGQVYVQAKPPIGNDGGSSTGQVAFAGDVAQVNIQFVGTGQVNGAVTTAAGTPVSGLRVFIVRNTTAFPYYNADTLTDGNGHFAFSGVPVGDVNLTANQPSTGLAGSAAGKISAPDATLNLTLTLAEAGTVRGRVLRTDGTPAAKMALEILGNNVTRFGSTADDGAFVFTDLKLGNYALTVTDPLGTGLAKATAALTTQGQIVDLHDLRLDTAPPAATVITPTNNAINAPVSQPIQVRFSEPVVTTTVNSNNLVVSNNSGPLTGAWSLSNDGTLASFAVTGGKFRDFDHINLRIKTGITDLVGRALPAEVLSSFTTSDGTPPLISSRSPASGTQAVALNAVVRINYAEAIDPTKFATPTQPITVSLNGAPVAGRIDFILNNTVIVFTPNKPLSSNATYRVTLQPATDLFGNKQASGDTFTFTTVDLVAPVIQELTSSAGTTVRVGASTAIVATLEPAPDIAQVEFFVNGQSRAIAKTEPYSYLLPLNSTSGAQLVVSAKATDRSGNVSASKTVTLTVQSDLAPVVTIITPTNGTIVRSGSQVQMRVRASDDVGLNKFFFQATGAVTTNSTQSAPANTTVYTPTFTVNIPANAAPGSAVMLQVSATDTANQPSATKAVTVTVQDAAPPVVQFSAPVNGAVVNPGAVVNVVVSASDTGKVASITLQASGAANLTTTVPISPARVIISVTVPVTVSAAATAKDHVVLLARATDSAGNVSQPISLTLGIRDLLNPLVRASLPAGVTNIAPGQSIQVSVVATDEIGLSNIGLRTTGAVTTTQSRLVNPVKLTTTALFTVTAPLTVSAQSVFTFTGTATDTSGNVGVATPITLPVAVDQLPVVSISSPISGSLVSTGGQVTVTVRASDDGGISQIELATSGGVTVTQRITVTPAAASYTAPFTLNIPANTPLGNLVLRASAVDNRQQRSASAPVVLTIVDATLPTAQITSPANNTGIKPGAVITVSVTAADNGGVAALDLQTSGAFAQQVHQVISPTRTSVAAKLLITVPPTVTANALVTVTVRASDGAGNLSQPAAILMKVLDVVKPVVTLTLPNGISQVRQGKAITVTVAATDKVGVTNLGFRTAGAFVQTGTKAINPAQPSATNSFGVQVPLTATVGSSFTVVGTAQDAALNSDVSTSIALTVAAPLANVTGLVTNASGQPVTNATVTVLAANGTFNTSTDADGRYQVANIAEGAVTVRAVAPVTNLRGSGVGVVQANDQQVTINVRISDAPLVAITAPLTGTTVFERATVPVTVTATSDVGIRNVQFLVNGSVVFTDTTAPYRFDLVAPVGVTSQTLGARAVDTEGNSRAAANVVIHVAPDTQTIVVGRVVDSNGNGMAGVTVTTVNNLTSSTGPTGTFSIANVPTTQGNIQVLARATVNGQPWQGKSATATPVPGGVTNVGTILIKLLKVWDGGGDHVSWQNAANWNNDTLPSTTDDVYIPITATVNLNAGTATINSLTSDGALQISGATLSLASASTVNNAFTLSSGSLTGSGSITITGATTIKGGTLRGSGRTVVKGGLLISNGGLTLDGRTLDNVGVATWTDQYIYLNNGAVFNNLPGSTFNMALSSSYSLQSSAGVTGQFNNAGSLVKTGSIDNSIDIPFSNTGSVVVGNGTLTLNGGGSNSGSIEVRSGTTLALNTTAYTFALGSSVSGGGAFVVKGGAVTVAGTYNITGTLTANGGVLTFAPSATVRSWGSKLTVSNSTTTLKLNTGQPLTLTTISLANSATLSSTSAITITNGLTVTSGTLRGSGRTVVKGGLLISNGGMTLDGRTLDNVGVATWTDQYIYLNNGAVFNNLPGSTFNMALSSSYSLQSSAGVTGQFNNAGSLVKTGSASNSVSIPFTNTGVITVSAGTLDFSAGYVQTAGVTKLNGGAIKSSTPLQILGGKFTGIGPVTGDLSNRGLVEPGNAIGALSVSGKYAQTGSGMLRVEISGTVPAGGFDQLNVTGAATLSGTLAISLTNGFQPNIGATFTIMTFGSHTGVFTQTNGLSIGNGTHFLVTYNNTNVVLQVVADTVTATSLDNSTMLTETGEGQAAVLAPTTPEAQPGVTTTNAATLRLYLPLVTNNTAGQNKVDAPAAAPDANTVTPQSVRPTEPTESAVAAVLGYQLYLPVLMR